MLPFLPALLLLILQGPSDFERLARVHALEAPSARVEAPMAAVLRCYGIAVLELQAARTRQTLTPQYRNNAAPPRALGILQKAFPKHARSRDGPRAA